MLIIIEEEESREGVSRLIKIVWSLNKVYTDYHKKNVHFWTLIEDTGSILTTQDSPFSEVLIYNVIQYTAHCWASRQKFIPATPCARAVCPLINIHACSTSLAMRGSTLKTGIALTGH